MRQIQLSIIIISLILSLALAQSNFLGQKQTSQSSNPSQNQQIPPNGVPDKKADQTNLPDNQKNPQSKENQGGPILTQQGQNGNTPQQGKQEPSGKSNQDGKGQEKSQNQQGPQKPNYQGNP